MDSVLATVSGYHGAERFNLIKLIASTGASYVGKMFPNVTHLVSRDFEGKKYEFAKRLGIIVVNHRWVEECVTKKRRVSEAPYTFESGKEVGPLRLDIQLSINNDVAYSKEKKKYKQPVIDIKCDDTDDANLADSDLFNEVNNAVARSKEKQKYKQPVIDLECDDTDDANLADSDLFNEDFELRNKTHGSNRLLRKPTKSNSSNDQPSSLRDSGILPETALPEVKEPGTSQPTHLRRLRKRNFISLETHQEDHAPVKKLISKQDKRSTLNMERGHLEVNLLAENTSRRSLPSSAIERDQNTSTIHTIYELGSGQNDDTVDDIEEIKDMYHELLNTCVHGTPSTPDIQNSKDHHEDSREDLADRDQSSGPSKSNELSCVICWTEFSSTRGVLPCGHRFCFSCIQSWADHMASRKKPSTCPLCKSSFICITKLDDVHSSDQKIYSQTIPHDSSKTDLYILPDETCAAPANPATQVCYRCSNREPEDLLVKCHYCNIRCVHRYCLDPPLFPWTCVHCKDLRMLYYNRY